MIASLVDHWTPQPVAVTATRDPERLILELRASARPPTDRLGIEDRVGALDGSLSVQTPSSGQTHVRLELPCA